MKHFFLVITGLLFLAQVKANDTLKTLPPEKFLQIVKSFHPVAKIAAIQKDKAKAGLLISKGNFDPVIQSIAGNKIFDGINYYQTNTTQLSIPAWYGIEVSAGIEYLGGTRTNPTETSGKTSFTGISIPLAKNLLMDKRRAALLHSKIMVTASEQEQRMILNDLMFDAADAYWQWVQAWFIYNNYTSVKEVNKKKDRLRSNIFSPWRKACN